MDEYYNKHYIRVDVDNNIILGWSDAFPFPVIQREDICINEQGSYQFRLFPDGEENPLLKNDNDVYLYRYVDGKVIAKTQEELQAETPKPQPPIPTLEEQIKILSAAVMEMASEIYG